MKVLWAPWRMKYVEYVTFKKKSTCFLCDIASNPVEDDKNFVIYRSTTCFALLNLYPYNTAHTLIAPYRHVPSLEDLSDEELLDLMKTVNLVLKAIRKSYKPDGFNVGVNLGRVAGAGLETHVHIHVVPRWNGDTNFMPILASTKVIPEALVDTYNRLKKALSESESKN